MKKVAIFLSVALTLIAQSRSFAAREFPPRPEPSPARGVRILSGDDAQRLHSLVRRTLDRAQVSTTNERRDSVAVSAHRQSSRYNPDGRMGYVGSRARLDIRGKGVVGLFTHDVTVVHVRANVHLAGRARGLHTVWVYLDPQSGNFLSGHVVTKLGTHKPRRINLTAAQIIGQTGDKRAFANAVRLGLRWFERGPEVGVRALSRFIARRI